MKFSEIPLYTLENFLKDLFYIEQSYRSPYALKNAYLKGPRKTLTSIKYQKFQGYVKKTEGYKNIIFNVNSTQWNTRTEATKDLVYLEIVSGDRYTIDDYESIFGVTAPSQWTSTGYHQDTEKTTWTIVHNSGFTPTWITITDEQGNTLIPNSKTLTINSIILTFDEVQSGYVQFGFVNNEDEMYFKKNQEFYKWIINTESSEDELTADQINFININKSFLYVGLLYKVSNSFSANWNLQHYGMKNFVINSLPDHQKTGGISAWFRYFFDRVYQKGYYAVANVNTLIDPDECPTNQLPYLAKYTNLDINNYNLDESTTRALIKSHVDLLKRKGTYPALEELWKMIVPNSSNKMTVYDRWHNMKVVEDKLNPSEYFVDFPWKNFYLYLDPYLQVSSNFDHFLTDDLPWALTYPITLDQYYEGREIQKLNIASTHWLVYTSKNYVYEPLISIYDENKRKIKPKNISRVGKHFFKIYLSDDTPLAGYVFIFSSDYKE